MRDAQGHFLRLATFAAFEVNLPNVITRGFDRIHHATGGTLENQGLRAVEEQITFAGTGIGQFDPYAGRGGIDFLEFGGTTEDVEIGTDDYRLTGATIEIGQHEVLAAAAG